MKNKGRKHLSGVDSKSGSMDCKGYTTHLTRPIGSMSSRGKAGYFTRGGKKFDKKKWQKRVRGYLKSERGQEIFFEVSLNNIQTYWLLSEMLIQ